MDAKIIAAANKLQVPITKPQLELLLNLHERGLTYIADYYPPAKALVKDRRAEWAGDKLKLTAVGWALASQIVAEAAKA